MSKNSRRRIGDNLQLHRQSAEALARLLRSEAALLRGVVSMRKLGPRGAAIADTILAGELSTLGLSWELWDALTAGDGHEPEDLLLAFVEEDLISTAREALGLRPYGCGPEAA